VDVFGPYFLKALTNFVLFGCAGDLKTYLLARRHLVNDRFREESDEISSKRLTSMALDIARALSYLSDLKYVHRYEKVVF